MGDCPIGVIDSGNKKTFDSGMVRNANTSKLRYNAVFEGPMFKRWARRLWDAKPIYPDPSPGVGNWTLADGPEELQRAKESAVSHFVDWLDGVTDEDHAAAVFFNINLVEYVKDKIAAKKPQTTGAAVNRNYVPKLPGTDIRDLGSLEKLWDDCEVKSRFVHVPQYSPLTTPSPLHFPGSPYYPAVGPVTCADGQKLPIVGTNNGHPVYGLPVDEAPCEMCGQAVRDTNLRDISGSN